MINKREWSEHNPEGVQKGINHHKKKKGWEKEKPS